MRETARGVRGDARKDAQGETEDRRLQRTRTETIGARAVTALKNKQMTEQALATRDARGKKRNQ